MAEQKKVNISSLTPQQLLQLKNDLEQQLQVFNDNLNQFRIAVNKYEDLKITVTQMKEPTNLNKPVMIPLTQSLYIEGTIKDNDKFTLDYGTGYYAERNSQQTSDYANRKIQLIKENIQKVSEISSQKQRLLEQVIIELQKKIQIAQENLQKKQ